MANTPSSLYQSCEFSRSEHPEDEVHKHVEEFLGGRVLSSSATPVVEEVLFDQGLLHHIVYAGRTMARSLRGSGFSVQIQYCTSASHGHPIPFLITRNANGQLVVPTNTPRDAYCSGSTFYVIRCSAGAEDIPHAIQPELSEGQTIAHSSGAVVVVPKATRTVVNTTPACNSCKQTQRYQ